MVQDFVAAAYRWVVGSAELFRQLLWLIVIASLGGAALWLAVRRLSPAEADRAQASLKELGLRLRRLIVVALAVVLISGALAQFRKMVEERRVALIGATASRRNEPRLSGVEQYAPSVAVMRDRTYTRTLTLPPHFLDRIGAEGVQVLAPYLSDPSADDVLKMVDNFRRSGAEVVFTRELTRRDENPVSADAADVGVKFENEGAPSGQRHFEVTFIGTYRFHNPNDTPQTMRFNFPPPQGGGTIQGFCFDIAGARVTEPDEHGLYVWTDPGVARRYQKTTPGGRTAPRLGHSRRTILYEMAWRGLIDKYGDRMDISKAVSPITLYEGNTPLIPAPRLASEVAPGAEIWLKYEGLNPTGSFKDRGMTTAITQAAADGATAVICASTGNTAASAAAYAARAGMKCAVLIPEGKVALGKLAGAIAYGADVVAIRGSFDDGLDMVREISRTHPIALVNSVNPARLEGQKTAAWELIDQLGAPPDWLSLPVGNAGNISAYWLGFRQSGDPRLPRMLGTQAAGAAPIVTGKRVDNPETLATAIRIGNPARWHQAEDALRESCGHILAVSDDQILEAQSLLATREGVYCEPSSAASLAGLRSAIKNGLVEPDGLRIVLVLTGHGMKDPDTTVSRFSMRPPIEPTTAALVARLEAA